MYFLLNCLPKSGHSLRQILTNNKGRKNYIRISYIINVQIVANYHESTTDHHADHEERREN